MPIASEYDRPVGADVLDSPKGGGNINSRGPSLRDLFFRIVMRFIFAMGDAYC